MECAREYNVYFHVPRVDFSFVDLDFMYYIVYHIYTICMYIYFDDDWCPLYGSCINLNSSVAMNSALVAWKMLHGKIFIPAIESLQRKHFAMCTNAHT